MSQLGPEALLLWAILSALVGTGYEVQWELNLFALAAIRVSGLPLVSVRQISSRV